MTNKILHFMTNISLVMALTSAAAQQDRNAFRDDYGNSYGQDYKPKIFPERDNGNDDYEEDNNPGTGEEDGGSVEGPAAPLDTYLAYLLFAGVGIGGFYFRTCRE